jgi:hypothetical protein
MAYEYGIDYLTMQKHRTHKSVPKGRKAPLSEETKQRIDRGTEMIEKYYQQRLEEHEDRSS